MTTHTPARTLPEATRCLNADEPLPSGDSRYVDLSAGRGDDSLKQMERFFRHKEQGDPKHMVFASHRGAGKTTELHRLRHHLQDRYFSLYFEANVEMDANQIEMEDLLLVLCQQVAKEMEANHLPLDPALLDEVGKWFAEVTQTTSVGKQYKADVETQIQLGTTFFGGLMARMTALFKVESEHRKQVKEVLRKYPGTLLDLCNKLLEAANNRLRTDCNQELLVVIDNLDRYEPSVINLLLVHQGDRFTRLKCNLILTPPILLLYQSDGNLSDYFKFFLMPALQLRLKDEAYNVTSGLGAPLLLQALERRIDIRTLLPDLKLQQRLIVASGGSIRELIKLTGDAVLIANGNFLTEPDVTRAINKHKGQQRNKINANGWAKVLAQISITKQITSDPACIKLLHQRLAFEYNGETWHDINPLVAELPEVQREIVAARAAAA